jgi:hypothetical protein
VRVYLPEGRVEARTLKQAVRARCQLEDAVPLLVADVREGKFTALYLQDDAWLEPSRTIHLYVLGLRTNLHTHTHRGGGRHALQTEKGGALINGV